MAWLFLLVAGALEVFWSTCLKFSQGLTVPKFTVCTIVGMVLSFVFLSQATKVLPLGTSYAIWTGIGALGAVVVGVVIFHESLSPARLLFVALLLVGIIGNFIMGMTATRLMTLSLAGFKGLHKKWLFGGARGDE